MMGAIIQARMTSSRLPGKVLLPLGPKPVINHVVSGVKICPIIDRVIVATSVESSDDPIFHWCVNNSVDVFRGDLNDVLDRYYNAAKHYKLDHIIRVTADCPLINPNLISKVINFYKINKADVSYLGGEFPNGLDIQVVNFKTLSTCWQKAISKYDREHVFSFAEKTNPGKFRIYPLLFNSTKYNFRITLDTNGDYIFLKTLFDKYCDDFGNISRDLDKINNFIKGLYQLPASNCNYDY